MRGRNIYLKFLEASKCINHRRDEEAGASSRHSQPGGWERENERREKAEEVGAFRSHFYHQGWEQERDTLLLVHHASFLPTAVFLTV
jgi:hypothetical protein